MTAFCRKTVCLFQQVACSFELCNLLCRNVDGLSSSRVTAFSGRTLKDGQSAETDEGQLSTFLEFFLGDFHEGVDSLSGVNFGHAGFLGNGAD